MSGVSLNEILVDGPLFEAVKLKPRYSWRTQDVRDARIVRYLPRGASNSKWNQLKRKKCAAVKKPEQIWRLKEHFEFAQLVFVLAVIQYFLAMLLSLYFGMMQHSQSQHHICLHASMLTPMTMIMD